MKIYIQGEVQNILKQAFDLNIKLEDINALRNNIESGFKIF